jgi:predicted deacylase
MPQTLAYLRLPGTGRGPRDLPVLSFSAGAGPTVVVTSNVHGDEATGVGVIHGLAARLERLLQRGTVHLYPSLNPEGLIQRTRTVPADSRDLNRLWPGDRYGGPSERVAQVLWDDIVGREPEVLIDLHTDSPASIPYAIVDRAVRGLSRKRRRLTEQGDALAGATGLTVLREYPKERYLDYQLDRSLTGAMVNVLGVPAITLECGPRLYLEPRAVEVATQAVLGALTQAGLVEVPAPAHSSRLPEGPWRRESGPRVGVAGVFRALVQPGQAFERGQVMAQVCNLEGRVLEVIEARHSGHVISLPERAWIVPGLSAGTYAVADR